MTDSSIKLRLDFHGQNVRVETNEDGAPLFNANDICEILEHSNPRAALKANVDRDDVSSAYVIDSLGRQQQANYLTEPGVWSLVFASRAKNAKTVKRWLAREVLPELRRTGQYHANANHEATSLVSERAALGAHRITMMRALSREDAPQLRQTIHNELEWVCGVLGESAPALAEIAPPDMKWRHNIIVEFFQAVSDLVNQHGCELDHATATDQVALNIKEVSGFAQAYDVPIASRSSLIRALKGCAAPRLVDSNYAVRSGLTGATKKCWVFEVNPNALADKGVDALLDVAAPDMGEDLVKTLGLI